MAHNLIPPFMMRETGLQVNDIPKCDDNPLLNSIQYEVKFPDGQVKEYSVNVIVENILSQVDSEGFSTTMIEAVVDYEVDPTVTVNDEDKYIVLKNRVQHLRKMTKGWRLLVLRRDRSESWIPLKNLKN